MDILMGFGAVLVGVGTLMAIRGANPTVYLISNLLSGYIGNTPGGLPSKPSGLRWLRENALVASEVY
ncbi:unnamed protein product [Calypogeia fissa]